MTLKNIIVMSLAAAVMGLGLIAPVPAEFNPLGVAQSFACTKGESGCSEVKRQTGRDTSGGKIVAFANHCDTTLRRVGEAVSFQVTPAGHKAYSKSAKKLPGLSWASNSKAGNRFAKHGIKAKDGRVIIETELCASSGTWARAFAAVGVTPDDVLSGRVIVWLCGEQKAHKIPVRRLSFLKGRKSKGVYSVLSTRDTKMAERKLTQLGY